MKSIRYALMILTALAVPGCFEVGGDTNEVDVIDFGDGTQTIGSQGGILYSSDGRFEIAFPVGAVENETTFTVASVAAGDGAVGTVYEVSPTEPLVVEAHVTYRLDAADYEGEVDQLRLAVYGGERFVALGGAVVDPNAQVVEAGTPSTGLFGLVVAGCDSDDICEQGEVCEAGTCRPEASAEGCTQELSCERGFQCVLGECAPLQPCVGPEDCNAEHKCQEDYCTPRPSCETTDDCNGDAGVCVNGTCVESDGTCADRDCPIGQHCEAGACVADDIPCDESDACPAFYTCVAELCVPEAAECVTTDDCAPGHLCSDGVCVMSTTCETDDDCADGRICTSNVCL